MMRKLLVAMSLALLVVLDVVMIWLAGRAFRVNTLLAGQAPKLRDMNAGPWTLFKAGQRER